MWTRIATTVQTARGWKRNAIAFLAGVASVLALPPFYALPFLVVGLGLWIWLLYASPSFWRSIWDGWWFGVGYFLAGTYWISIALTADIAQFGWMIPFSLIGLSGGLALFMALVGGASWWWRKATPLGFVCALTALWIVVEYLRTYLFTGFPWNLLGYASTVLDPLAQSASVVGIYGVGLLLFWMAATPALLAYDRSYWRACAVAGMVLIAMLGYGGWRLASAPDDASSGVRVRMVQANIPQQLKWDPAFREASLRTHAALTTADGWEDIDIVIWPETALPFVLDSDSQWPDLLADLVPPGGVLITGAVWLENSGDTQKIRNSIIAIDEAGVVVGRYNKQHLVPFGEYVPFRSVLPIEKITAGMQDFTPGTDTRLMHFGTFPSATPLICYEAIFPQYAKIEKAGWLLNLTNDAWFGFSSGPFQHNQMARMRAVEQGKPLVRVANTGISIIYNGYGLNLGHIELNREGVLDVELPVAMPATPYHFVGEFLVLIQLFLLFGYSVWSRKI